MILFLDHPVRRQWPARVPVVELGDFGHHLALAKAVARTASGILRFACFVSLTGFGTCLEPCRFAATALAIGGIMLVPNVIEIIDLVRAAWLCR